MPRPRKPPVPSLLRPFLRGESWLLLLTLAFAAAALVFWLTRATVLRLGVAGTGTEAALLQAYAETSVTRRSGIRFEIVPFPDARGSGEALNSGKVDLALVRPDILMPANGLTLVVLRDFAMVVVVKETSPIAALSDLAGRRLAIPVEQEADRPLVATVLERVGLELRDAPAGGSAGDDAVALLPLGRDEIGPALATGRVDAVMLAMAPASQEMKAAIDLLDTAAGDRPLRLVGVPDAPAILARHPKLQGVTIPAGLFGSDPKLPEEDLSTVGPTYRLMARADLSRSVAAEVTQHIFEHRAEVAAKVSAADEITFPAYETTAAATTARLPNHPGAIDYFEREQESFIERYESWIYLVAILGGGLGSALAWLRQMLFRAGRERIQVATARLLAIRSDATRTSDAERLRAMADEVDSIAANIARQALGRGADSRLLEAASVAIDAARSTVARARSA